MNKNENSKIGVSFVAFRKQGQEFRLPNLRLKSHSKFE